MSIFERLTAFSGHTEKQVTSQGYCWLDFLGLIWSLTEVKPLPFGNLLLRRLHQGLDQGWTSDWSHLGTMDPWLIAPAERVRHEEQFRSLMPAANGMVTGAQARNFFLQSGLQPIVLAQIWWVLLVLPSTAAIALKWPREWQMPGSHFFARRPPAS